MEHLSDAELIPLARRHPQAFEVLMRRHGGRMHAVAQALVGASSADDVLQEAFWSAYQALGRFRGEAEFGTWLHRIVLNACYAKLRKTPYKALEDYELAAHHNPHLSAERQQLRHWIDEGLQHLPQDQREAFSLREMGGLEYENIAELLGIQLGTVKSRIHRAKTALKNFLLRKGFKP